MAGQMPRLRAPSDDPRPASAVSTGVGLAGLAGLLLWVAIGRSLDARGPLAALCGLLACGVPMLAWSLLIDKVHRNPSTGIDWSAPPRPAAETRAISATKLAGLWATWAAIGCFYCIARWYWRGNYPFAMAVLGWAAVPLLLLSIPYVLWLDRRLTEPRDGAWHLGMLVGGRGGEADRGAIVEFLRAWTVKGFFLAFMLSIVPPNWWEVMAPPAGAILADPVALARWLIALMFLIDVSFATVGYALTLRPLDAHIRSANPYASGWAAALICYPPFILMAPGGPLDYQHDDHAWQALLAGWPLATAIVAAALVLLAGIYAWATVAFGLRFSNLTNRGILTHGPYAWTKHPAYLSKNLFWWLASLPFLAASGSIVDAIRNTAILAAVSGVYYWRALTEERHLGSDPDYRDYAGWMERNAPLPRLVRAWRRATTPVSAPAE